MKVSERLQDEYFPHARVCEFEFSKYDIRVYRQKVLYFTSISTFLTSLYFIDIKSKLISSLKLRHIKWILETIITFCYCVSWQKTVIKIW